jgi:hypothetical protein
MAQPGRRFLFRLALQLGFPHPDHLLRCLDSHQLSEWIAFAGLEPFGDLRADFRAGQIAATLANVHRGKETEPFHASDFFSTLADAGRKSPDSPVLLADPEAHAKLIKATLFGQT